MLKPRFTSVLLGYQHTLVAGSIESSGSLWSGSHWSGGTKVWSFGSNEFGQLGDKRHQSAYSVPTRVGCLDDPVWVNTFGETCAHYAEDPGLCEDAWLSVDGNSVDATSVCCACGGSCAYYSTCREPTGFEPWVAGCAGKDHTLLLDKDRRLWATGNNRYGQAGVIEGETGDEHRAPRILKLNGTFPVGSVLSECVDLPGRVGSLWSDGTNGCAEYAENEGFCQEYGATDYNGEGSANERCCACGGGTMDVLSRHAEFYSRNVVAFACGGEHSLVFTEDGRLWSFGRNDLGQLMRQDNLGLANTNPIPDLVPEEMLSAGGVNPQTLLHVWAAGDNSILQTSRHLCYPGYFSIDGLQPCAACDAGKYSDKNGSMTCISCAKGFYAPEMSAQCLPCPQGSYSDQIAQSECRQCLPPLDYTAREAAVSVDNCTVACLAGTYGPSGAGPCTVCERGKYSKYASSECTDCQIGKYQQYNESSSCNTCPDGQSTANEGTVDQAQCRQVCLPGFFGPSGLAESTFLSYWNATFDFSLNYTFEITNGTVIASCSAANCSCSSAGVSGTISPWNRSCGCGCVETISEIRECLPCAKGYFAPSMRAPECTPCDLNTYQESPAMSSCSLCPDGEGTRQRGTSDGANCFPFCEPGEYNATGVAPCSACSAGKYANITGTTRCLDCTPGTYSEVGSSACGTCSAGTFSIGSSAECTQCPEGQYQDRSAQSSCTPCAQGTYSDQPGSTNCIECAVGLDTIGSGSDSENDCAELCERGTFADDGLVSGGVPCGNCPAGSASFHHYQTGLGGDCGGESWGPEEVLEEYPEYDTDYFAECIAAPSDLDGGHWEDNWGDDCGDYGDNPHWCGPDGAYGANNANGAGMPNDKCCACGGGLRGCLLHEWPYACASCTPGYFAVEGSTYCDRCRAGTFSTESASSACLLCEAGQSSLVGSTFCTDCSPGTAADQAGTTCEPCAPGSYQTGSGASSCVLCTAGFYSSETGAQVECSECVAGTYSSNPGASICLNCLAGSFAPSEQATACNLCAPGYFASQDRSVLCSPCAPGSFAVGAGAPICRHCDAGFSSPSAATNCTLCPKGTYSGVEVEIVSTTCVDDDSWEDSYGNDCAAYVTQCDDDPSFIDIEGYSCAGWGGYDCFDSWDGYTSADMEAVQNACPDTCGNCPNAYSGTITDASSSRCNNASSYAVGGIDASMVCCTCGGGSNTSKTEDGSSVEWQEEGSYVTVADTSCVFCPEGYDTLGPGSNSSSQCLKICLPGQYGRQGLSNSNIESCASCQPGTISQLSYATSCIQCDSGKYAPDSSMSSCLACGPGTYSAVGSSHCSECSAGKYTADASSSNCSVCPPGHYIDEDGASACKVCGYGRFSLPHRKFCSECGPKTSTATQTSTSANDCNAFCGPGTFGQDNGVNTPESPCQPCGKGTFNNYTKQSACFLCPPGTFGNATSALKCERCPLDTWQNTSGSTSCKACPLMDSVCATCLSNDTRTRIPGASTVTECRVYDKAECLQSPRNLSRYPVYAAGDWTYGAAYDEASILLQGQWYERLKPALATCDLLGHEEVSLIRSSGDHTMAQTAEWTPSYPGRFRTSLWSWGLNSHGQLGTPNGLGTKDRNPVPTLISRVFFPSLRHGNHISQGLGNNRFYYLVWDEGLESKRSFNVTIPDGIYNPIDLADLISARASADHAHPPGIFRVRHERQTQGIIFQVTRPGFQADFRPNDTVHENLGFPAGSRFPPLSSVNEVSKMARNNIFRYR